MGLTVEPMKEQVKLDNTVGNANYSAAFDNAAMTPGMLSQIGTVVSQSASNALSTKWGYQEGLNPHGDLLPPITSADKVYQQAYLAQSNNTLSLQINSMMMKGNEELAKANELTPSMIGDYTKQMAEGTKDILDNAPTTVRASLGYQYASRLQNTMHGLNLKMASQNKQKAIEHMNVVDKETDTDIINSAMSGDLARAKTLYESKKAKNQQQRNAGMMSETQEYTSNEAAKLSYYTAVSNANAIQARKMGGDHLDKYLSSLANLDNKPSELSYDQYNTMGNNTLRFMNHLDSLQSNERNDILTNLDSKIYEGTLTDQDIETAKATNILKSSDINKMTAKWNRWQTLHGDSENQLLATSKGFTDTVSYSAATSKDQDKAFNSLVGNIKAKRPDAEAGTIEAEVASTAGGPNTAFFKQLTALSRSAIPEEMERASRMYGIVNSRSRENLFGLPTETLDNIRAFNAFKSLYPGDLNTASAYTRQVLMHQTQDEKEATNAIANDYRQNNLATPKDRLLYAKNVLSANGFFFNPDVLAANETSTHISNILDRYIKLFKGNIDAAKHATEDAASTIYGETHANGGNEVANLPIEKFTGYGRKSTFFVQHDAINSLQTQFGEYRKAFDEGRSHFFYRVKDADKWSLSSLQSTINQSKALKKEMESVDTQMQKLNEKRNDEGYFQSMQHDKAFEELNKKRNELGKKLTPIEETLSGINKWDSKIEIEQVWRGSNNNDGKVETYSLSMNAAENASFSYDATQPVIGDYDIFLISSKGVRTSIQALAGHSVLPVVYTPDFKQIRNNTAGFINSTGGQTSYEEAMRKYKEGLNKPKNKISNEVLSTRGLTAEVARRQLLGGNDGE